MKVVAINGSPRKNSNTSLGLAEAMTVLRAEGIETEQINIGTRALHGCISCGGCARNKDRKCTLGDDPLNGWLETIFTADGIILGTPVYYAGINGSVKSLLDRAFYVGSANGRLFRHKVGAAIVSVRRAGSIAALDQLHKYFTISEMLIPGSSYWSMIYGMTPGEAAQDVEGTQCVRILARNMAWLMKLIEYGREAVPPPAPEEKTPMNFIR